MKFYGKARYYLALAAVALCGSFSVFAEDGGAAVIDQSYIDTWVTSATTAISQWITKLGPLFTAALGIVLALAAWAIFKKVTNKAK